MDAATESFSENLQWKTTFSWDCWCPAAEFFIACALQHVAIKCSLWLKHCPSPSSQEKVSELSAEKEALSEKLKAEEERRKQILDKSLVSLSHQSPSPSRVSVYFTKVFHFRSCDHKCPLLAGERQHQSVDDVLCFCRRTLTHCTWSRSWKASRWC